MFCITLPWGVAENGAPIFQSKRGYGDAYSLHVQVCAPLEAIHGRIALQTGCCAKNLARAEDFMRPSLARWANRGHVMST